MCLTHDPTEGKNAKITEQTKAVTKHQGYTPAMTPQIAVEE